MKSWKSTFVALYDLRVLRLRPSRDGERQSSRGLPTTAASECKLTPANQRLAAAERAQPLVALGDDLSAAKLSLHVLEQQPERFVSAKHLQLFRRAGG